MNACHHWFMDSLSRSKVEPDGSLRELGRHIASGPLPDSEPFTPDERCARVEHVVCVKFATGSRARPAESQDIDDPQLDLIHPLRIHSALLDDVHRHVARIAELRTIVNQSAACDTVYSDRNVRHGLTLAQSLSPQLDSENRSGGDELVLYEAVFSSHRVLLSRE